MKRKKPTLTITGSGLKDRILGVGLALVLILSLTVGVAAPAAADDNEWSTHNYFKDGEDSDWFYNSAIPILDGPGPMAKSIDGTLWLYVALDDDLSGGLTAGDYQIFTSTDDGRSWEETDYAKDLTGEVAVVDMAPSPTDADAMYVTDGAKVYYTKNGGGKWELVADTSLGIALPAGEVITCIDMSYADNGDAYVFIGTRSGAGYTGSVFYVNQNGYPSQWTDLEVKAAGAYVYNIYAIAAAPDFADSDEIFALVTNNTPYTAVLNNVHGAVGSWGDMEAVLTDSADAAMEIDGASRFVFPSDFDDEYEWFVGVSGVGVSGSVHRINDDIAYNLGEDDADIDVDVVSLDLVGAYGSVQLLAGTDAAVADEVLISTDDGEKWDDMEKDPFGAGDTYVVMDADFADNGTAWAAVAGVDGGVSETIDTAEHFNQISMINVNMDAVIAIEFAGDTMMMLTNDATSANESVWMKNSDWERVDVQAALDALQASPESEDTIYTANKGTNMIYRSTNGGDKWKELAVGPHGTAITSLLVIDDNTVITGDNGKVYITDNYGRRKWDKEDITSAGTIVDLALSPNFSADSTILAGDDGGSIFISEDMADSWDVIDKVDV
ncbi:hypothetical protein ACFLWY_05350, partial [Chloroflexota bacterium]